MSSSLNLSDIHLRPITQEVKPLSANFAKCSNTLKQFVGKLQTNCLSVFDHFVVLAVKGLRIPIKSGTRSGLELRTLLLVNQTLTLTMNCLIDRRDFNSEILTYSCHVNDNSWFSLHIFSLRTQLVNINDWKQLCEK